MNPKLEKLAEEFPTLSKLLTGMFDGSDTRSTWNAIVSGTDLPWIQVYKELDSPEWITRLEKVGAEVKNFSAKEIAEALPLLKSKRFDDRVKATEIILDRLNKAFAMGDRPEYVALVVKCIEQIGPDVLRFNPVIEQLYQNHLKIMRRVDPNYTIDVQKWLLRSESQTLRRVLEQLFFDTQFMKSLRKEDRLHVPVKADISTAAATIDEMMTLVAKKVPSKEKLLKDLKHLLKQGSGTLEELIEAGSLRARYSVAQLRTFLRADLSAILGSIGEVLAMPKQAARLKRAIERAGAGGKAIYLLGDVRASAVKMIVDDEAAKAAAAAYRETVEAAKAAGKRIPDPPPVPAPEKTIINVKFSDGMIADLGDPPKMRGIEIHEVKTHADDAIGEGAKQFDTNSNRTSLFTSISFGQAFKLENGVLTPVDISKLPGYDAKLGRVVFAESEDYVKGFLKRQEELDLKIADATKTKEGADLTEAISQLLREAAEQENKLRTLVNLQGARKVLFAPSDMQGSAFGGIALESLGYSYKAILDFCNLLLIHGGFKREF